MEFTVETTYDQKALTAMARALRKTVRRKHSRRSHVFGWSACLLGILLIFNAAEVNAKVIITALAVIFMLGALLFEDQLNGYIARKRGLPGLDRSSVTFHDKGYHSVTPIGSSDFSYDTILRFAETNDYFVFIFSKSHAQVYAKNGLTGVSSEEFAAFISQKTGKPVESV